MPIPCAVRFHGTDFDDANGVAFDPHGRVFVVGAGTDRGVPKGFVVRLEDGSETSRALIGDQPGPHGIGTIAYAVATDDDGNAYVTGSTMDPTIPVETDIGTAALRDVFVACVDPDGRVLYLRRFGAGPAGDGGGFGIAVDRDTRWVYVTGAVQGEAFPISPTAAHPGPAPRSGYDSFLLVLDENGRYRYSTLLSGGYFSSGYGLALDPATPGSGDVVITGHTVAGFAGAIPIGNPGSFLDAFVVRVTEQGRQIDATVIGGNGEASGRSVAIDGDGSVWIAGASDHEDLPTTDGSFLPRTYDPYVLSPNFNVLFAQFRHDLSLQTLSVLGGSGHDYAHALALATDDATAWITGWTNSPDLRTTEDAFRRAILGFEMYDGFLCQIGPHGIEDLRLASYLGGIYDDAPHGMAIDANDRAYIVGRTEADRQWGIADASGAMTARPFTAFSLMLDLG
jgi:Beta-propeller repeat